MPSEQQMSHRVVRNAAQPYISNLSPTTTDPCYIPGSENILTSINNTAERRPGFSDNVEATPTTFNNLQRMFTWDRTDGSFFIMFCDINSSNQATVYKKQSGIDTSAVLIYTDTGSGTPFDFVVSNNTLYFSNGHVAQKWDPVNGVTNWGIAIGSVNNATGPTIAGNGSDAGGGGVVWTNPNNVTSAVSFATVTLPATGNFSDLLDATQFGFTIPASTTIQGIAVTFDYIGPSSTNVRLLKAGVPIGTSKTTGAFGSVHTITMGANNDLWGASWTFNDINQTTFGVVFTCSNITVPPPGHSQTIDIRNVNITIYGLGGPTVTVSGSGSFTAVTGYEYVFCYGNSNTGHVSSPTPPSGSTGAFSNKLDATISLTASTDPQVNQIRLFRSTDSVAPGTTAQAYFELPSSPYPNTTQNVTDNAADTSLIVANIAPTATFNDPPTPGQCPVYFAGRIWMFTGNKVWFSGLEEILLGVPEESFPSGISGDFWAFDEPVQGLGVAGTGTSQTLLIYCGGRVYGITGFTLDTFQRALISNRRGCRNLTAISSLGGMVAWLDSANQIWATDGSSLQELGLPIRPDIENVTPSSCCITFHTAGVFHWLVFSTGTELFVYDVDTEQWMPPWTFSCQNLFSGEIAPGNYKLLASTPTKAIQLGSAHNDNGSAYSFVAQTNLFAMVPDFGNRFSYMAAGLYDEPSRTGMPWYFQVDTNSVSLSDVQFIQDDDPLNGSSVYTSVFANATTPQVAWNRQQGTNLVQNIYAVTQPLSRWIGWKVIGATADDDLRIYSFFTAYAMKR